MKEKTKRKRTGFTLVELLVAMLCASLVLLMVSSTVIFMTKTTDELIDVSEQTYKVKTIKDYVISQKFSTLPTGFDVDTENEKLLHNGSTIVEHTELLNITFSENEKFIYCTLIFPNETYHFVAGLKQGE